MRIPHIANGMGSTGNRSPMEVLREHPVLEEQRGVGDGHSEVVSVLFQRVTTIGEEGEGERGLGVCGEEARRGEVELGVGGNRLLDERPAEFGSDGLVIEAVSETLSEVNQLRLKTQCKRRVPISYREHVPSPNESG